VALTQPLKTELAIEIHMGEKATGIFVETVFWWIQEARRTPRLAVAETLNQEVSA
jgi:hypothetical protein